MGVRDGIVASRFFYLSPRNFLHAPVAAWRDVEFSEWPLFCGPSDVSHPAQETKCLSYMISQNIEVYSLLMGRLIAVSLRNFTFMVSL